MTFPKPPSLQSGHVTPPQSTATSRAIATKPSNEEIRKEIKPMTTEDFTFIFDQMLHPKHRQDHTVIRFIDSFIACRDIAQAAGEAGIDTRTAKKYLNRRDIYDCINKITEQSVLRFGIDQGQVVERVKEIAFVDPAEMVKDDGSFHENLKDVPPEVRRAIKKFKAKNLYEMDANGMPVVVGKLIEVEFWDKLKSAEMLGRESDLFKQTSVVEHGVTDNMAAILLGASERAEARRLAARETVERDVIEVKKDG